MPAYPRLSGADFSARPGQAKPNRPDFSARAYCVPAQTQPRRQPSPSRAKPRLPHPADHPTLSRPCPSFPAPADQPTLTLALRTSAG